MWNKEHIHLLRTRWLVRTEDNGVGFDKVFPASKRVSEQEQAGNATGFLPLAEDSLTQYNTILDAHLQGTGLMVFREESLSHPSWLLM